MVAAALLSPSCGRRTRHRDRRPEQAAASPSRRPLAGHRQPGARHRLAAASWARLGSVRHRGGHRHRRVAWRWACWPRRRGWVEGGDAALGLQPRLPALLTRHHASPRSYGPGLTTSHRRHRHVQHPGVRAHHAPRQRGRASSCWPRAAAARGATRITLDHVLPNIASPAHRCRRRSSSPSSSWPRRPELPRPRCAAAAPELGPYAQRGADA